MLENINLQKRISREEYRRIVPGLQLRLYDLEKACWDNGDLLLSSLKAGMPRAKGQPSRR
jgi:hypothetical protein